MSEVTAEMIERGRGLDPETAAERRRRAARVRQARERLTTSDTGDRSCDVELLLTYAEARTSSAISSFALILLVSFLSYYWVATNAVVIWAVLAASSYILCYGTAKNLSRLDGDKILVANWRSKIVAVELINGLVWAGASVLLLSSPDPNAKAFMLTVLLLVAAFNAMVNATVPIAVYSAIAPISVATFCYIGFKGFGDTSVALQMALISAHVFFYVLAKRFHQLATRACSSAPRRTISSPNWSRPRPIPTRRAVARRRPISPSRASSPR